MLKNLMFDLGFVVCERMKSLISLLILLILLPLCKSSSTLSPSLNDDVLGLMVFKADIRDPTGKLSSWNEDDDSPCNWDGIKCNPRSNRVSELNLDGFSLSGKLGRGLLQLQALRKLSLSNNNLTGSVIPALVRLPNLRILDLSDNIFTGALPNDFFRQCGPLRTVNFGNNKFSGQIPESLNSCVGITVLNLSANQFSGGIHYGIWGLQGLRSLDLSYNMLSDDIPESMDGLINLMTFNLSKNQLTGLIPGDIGECSLLKSVDFSGNLLSGNLPVSLLNLSSIGYLNVGGNSLVGQVPRWIGGMIGLEYLDLSANNFSDVLPNSLGKLRSLKVLNMSLNSLSGSLPESMVGCVSLQVIDFRQNLLNGYLPKWVFKVALQEILFSENKIGGAMGDALLLAEKISHDSLEVLDLSHNALTGAIPLALSNFSSLKFLNLSKNLLTGPIPKNIGELRALNILDLSQNKLKGSIPSEIRKAVALQELVLGKNFIEGIIPTSIDHCSSLSVLILSHNSLEGPIPLAISKLTGLQIVDLSSNNLIGTMPKQLENLQHLLSFNVSHNNLQGELPGGFFNTISPSSVLDNPSLCGSATKRSCSAVLPKPIVLNPNSTGDAFSSSSLPSTLGRKRNLLSISSLIAIGAAAVIIIGVIAITVLNLRVRASTSRSATALALSNGDDFSYSPSMDANAGKLVIFSGEPDFSTRTHTLLNKDCELGRGGFGAVYQTVLQNGCPVAIKKLTVSSLVKSQEDFEREVKKLGKIRHSNLVTLEGYYWTPSLQLLIYEFISGGSLHKYLHEGGENFLSWNDRFNIIVGMAKGLSHLHQLGVIHYNLKSSNILIDGLGEPKVGDFGLVRLLPMLDRYILSSKIQSALGYMAPEFACRTMKITEKCDVYGFGVLVLELVTGKRPVEYMEDDVVVLCDLVRGALDEGKVEECVDERLQGRFPAEETIPVMKLGLICTSQVPSNRPDMIEVVNILEFIRCPEGQEDSG